MPDQGPVVYCEQMVALLSEDVPGQLVQIQSTMFQQSGQSHLFEYFQSWP